MANELLKEVGNYKLVFQAKGLEQLTLNELEKEIVKSMNKTSIEEVYNDGEMSICDIAKYAMENKDGRYELHLALSTSAVDGPKGFQNGIEFYVHEINAGYHSLAFLPGYDWSEIKEKTTEILTTESITEQLYG